MGHRPEQVDEVLTKLLRITTATHMSWSFWKVFDYLRYHGIIKDDLRAGVPTEVSPIIKPVAAES